MCFCVSGLQLGRWRVWKAGSWQQRHPKIPQNHSRAAVQQSKSDSLTVTDGEFALFMLRCLSLFNTPGCGLRVCWLQTQRRCDERWRALHMGRRRLWPTRFMSAFSKTLRVYDFENLPIDALFCSRGRTQWQPESQHAHTGKGHQWCGSSGLR